MNSNTQGKLDEYLELYGEIQRKTGEEKVALTLLTEISKDRRVEEMKEDREKKNGEPATEKQKKFMDSLGVDYPKNITKKEASALIDEEMGRA
jgi:hypothetical protein